MRSWGEGMEFNLLGMRLGPRALIWVALLAFTAAFILITALLVASNLLNFTATLPLTLTGVGIYAAAIAIFARIGFGSIARLEHLALTDSLSKLPNRRALHLQIRETASPEDEVAVALIDLDGFKMVNDVYGHAIGDQLIKEIARILKEICTDEATAYRLGGDEFAITMIGPLAATLLEGISRRFLERLAQPIAIEDRRIAIGASIGLSRGKPEGGQSSSELLRRADVAMYVSKRGGKMRCTAFKADFDRDLEAVRDLDEEMRVALANGQFRVHYQPLVDANDGTIVAVESLIRWERPGGRNIGPNVFIPVAEETGLINAIGLWVLRQACNDALSWNGIKLSVNISAAQLRNPEFPIQLGQIMEETGFPPELLELEITETSLVLDPAVAERSLEVIRSFGVNVALDDFGTGYASIGFLRQFRFEKLKLDRSLVIDSTEDESSRAMMLSSISMARALGMNVTAEGVETEDQADMVRSAGCDQIQGWLYYRPMPAAEIEQHLSPSQAPAIKSDIRRRA